jgi:hypothetical protein
MGAWVAIGAAAPLLMKLSLAIMGRLLLTQLVKIAAAATAHPFAAEIFISIYTENSPVTVCHFYCRKLVPAGGIEPPTKGL